MTRHMIRLIVIFALALLVAPLAGDAQPATHVYRIGRLPIWRPSGRVSARSAMTRARSSSSNTAMPRGISNGSPPLPLSWSGSRWT